MLNNTPKKDLYNFQEAGYASNIRYYKTIEEAEKKLFNEFFSIGETKAIFIDEELKFREDQKKIIEVNYKHAPTQKRFQ